MKKVILTLALFTLLLNISAQSYTEEYTQQTRMLNNHGKSGKKGEFTYTLLVKDSNLYFQKEINSKKTAFKLLQETENYITGENSIGEIIFYDKTSKEVIIIKQHELFFFYTPNEQINSLMRYQRHFLKTPPRESLNFLFQKIGY